MSKRPNVAGVSTPSYCKVRQVGRWSAKVSGQTGQPGKGRVEMVMQRWESASQPCPLGAHGLVKETDKFMSKWPIG